MVRRKKSHPASQGGIAPGFLVAAPSLRDPNFARTVILLVEHGAEGTIGFIINRASEVTFEEVTRATKLNDAKPLSREGKLAGFPFGKELRAIPVLTGGPVLGTGWVVFDPRTADGDLASESVRVHEEISITSSKRILAACDEDMSRRYLFVGYAGWGAGQLDEELACGSWLCVSLTPEILFDCPIDERWTRALKSAGIDPGRIVPSASSGKAN